MEIKFECPGENTEKYKSFSVVIEKETTKVDNDDNEDIITISYNTNFLDSDRFISSSLSNFVDKLVEEIHKIKCKVSDCLLECESVNGNLLKIQIFF